MEFERLVLCFEVKIVFVEPSGVCLKTGNTVNQLWRAVGLSHAVCEKVVVPFMTRWNQHDESKSSGL